MRYELFLRAGASIDDEALTSTAQQAEAGGLHLDLYRADDGTLKGIDLGVDTTSPPTEARRLAELCWQAAAAHGLTVYDPQLGRAVEASATEEIVAHFERTVSFGGGGPVAPVQVTPSSTRAWLYLGAALLGLYLLSRLLTCSL